MNRGRPNIWLDGCETRFETTSQNERQVLYSMLHASGWVRDQDEERLEGNTRIYIRTGTGQRDLGQHVESFCELMEAEVELGEGARFIPDPLVNVLREGESRHRRTASRYRPVDQMSA